METSTPVTYKKDSSSSSEEGRRKRGCVVLCGNDVQIKLGSSSNLVMQPSPDYQHRFPHRLHQRPGTDAADQHASSDTEVYRRTRSPRRHVQPSAPGNQTLLRPWTDRAADTPRSHDEDSGQKEPVETTRPPSFNPSCPTTRYDETRPPAPAANVKSLEAALDDTHLSSSNCIMSVPGDSQNATAPPSYDELYGDNKDHQHYNHHHLQSQTTEQQHQQQQETTFQTSSVTGTTTDDSAVCHSSLPCVAEFGHYADPSSNPQPGWLTNPTRISVQPDQRGSPTLVVVDQSTSTVQVFTSKGECLLLLSVPRVNGGCFVGHCPSLLVLAVGTSVSVYEMDGRLVKEIPLRGRQQDDAVLTTVSYGERGFVAVRSGSLSICRGGITRPAVVHTLAGRYRADRGITPFVNVVDVAVDARRGHLVVLDAANPSVSSHCTALYVMNEDGAVLRAIRPARDPHCGALSQPFSVEVDRSGNVLVADGRRAVQFRVDDGRFLATLIGDDTTNPERQRRRHGVELRGIAVCSAGREQLLFAVLAGDRFAQIRAFSLQS